MEIPDAPFVSSDSFRETEGALAAKRMRTDSESGEMIPMETSSADSFQLSKSGIQFSAKYIGSIVIDFSLRAMGSKDVRERVLRECINKVCAAAELVNGEEYTEDQLALKLIGSTQPRIRNFDVGMNISSTAITIIHNDQAHPEKMGGLLGRHSLNDISIAGHGVGAAANCVAFIVKKQEDRTCHVFQLKDAAMERVLQCVHTAISQHSERIRAPEVTLDSAPRPKNARSNLEHQIWYHGAITRAEAERRIKREGDFLIRESNTQSGHVILTGSDRICTQHVLIQIEGNKCVYSREQQFESVVDLVQYHYNQMLPVRTDQSEMRLLRAIPRPEKL